MSTDAPTRSRSYTWGDPLAGAQAARRLSGLDYLQAMGRGEYPPPPIMNTLGFLPVQDGDLSAGRVVFRLMPEEYHYNPIGSVHGGVFATLLDSVVGCAVHSRLPAGVGYTTLDLTLRFLRPLTMTTGEVHAVGTVVSLSRQVATAEGQLLDERGRLYATATTSCLILRPETDTPAPRSTP